jgi:hypothetical protein
MIRLKAKVHGTPVDEMMHWRRGIIWTTDERKISGYRKLQLGIPEYRSGGRPFPVELVKGFSRMEYICQPHQQYDPQT